MKTTKKIALRFLYLAAKGAAREGFELYAGKNFIHHNVFFKGDAESLIKAIEKNAQENPNKIFEVKRALQDGDLVAVHSFAKQNPNDLGFALIHIFRFEDDKIVEVWDFGQAVPSEMKNENGMF